jgi:hypothetical protein
MAETDLTVHDLSRLKPEKFKGSIAAYYPEHPRALDNSGMVYWAVLVMENDLGRYLNRGENVSHIDRDKTNNAISNLNLGTPYTKKAEQEHKPSAKKRDGKPKADSPNRTNEKRVTLAGIGHWSRVKIEWPDAPTLARMLQERSPKHVAKSLGISINTLKSHCHDSNIPIASRQTRRLTTLDGGAWPDKEVLADLLWNKPTARVARELGESVARLRDYCVKIGVVIPSLKLRKKYKYFPEVRTGSTPVKTFEVEPVVQKASKFQIARNSLPENQRDTFDALVTDYRFYALSRTGRAYVCYAVLADLVKAGWILSKP